MRLSEAILLGDGKKRGSNAVWLTRDGLCGCAFGGALLAAGVTADELWAEMDAATTGDGDDSTFCILPELSCVKSRWPWLKDEHLDKITQLYGEVRYNDSPIEIVAAYARSIEPSPPPTHAATEGQPTHFSTEGGDPRRRTR